ncbi:MAG: hypothetical protein RLW87_20855 [Alphaproteobacteria bacterium]
MSGDKRVVLEGDDAIALWKQGAGIWNAWVVSNPETDVSFEGVDFSDHIADGDPVDFSAFRFPIGIIDFSNARFGDRRVSFADTVFNDGDVYFRRATFGDGDVSFRNAKIGVGRVTFQGAQFGNGDVKFRHTSFGSGDVNFSSAIFARGNVDFGHTKFGSGEKLFIATDFGSGRVDFKKSIFSDGLVNFSTSVFSRCEVVLFADISHGKGDFVFDTAFFGKQQVTFDRSIFGDGKVAFAKVNLTEVNLSFKKVTFGAEGVDFSDTQFGPNLVSFSGADFGARAFSLETARFDRTLINFDYALFGGLFNLLAGYNSGSLSISMQNTKFQDSANFDVLEAHHSPPLNLRNASFHGTLSISGYFTGIPDLRGSWTDHHVDLSRVHCTLSRHPIKLIREFLPLPFPADHPNLSLAGIACYLQGLARRPTLVAADPQDSARLQRMKEIAANNHDHAAALRFGADENRANRWINRSIPASLLDMAFSGICDYGQSILRPALALLALMSLFTLTYFGMSVPGATAEQAAILSLGTSIGFLPGSGAIREVALASLFGDGQPAGAIAVLTTLQATCSFICIFLIGLGLRNRFRL